MSLCPCLLGFKWKNNGKKEWTERESNVTHRGAIIQSIEPQSFFEEYLSPVNRGKRHKSFTFQSFLSIFIRENRLSFFLSSSHVEPGQPFVLLAAPFAVTING